MAKKKFGKFVALATISGVIAAGISYFLKYKSFHDELDEDFHDFEGNEDEFNGELPHESETPARTYVSLSEKKAEEETTDIQEEPVEPESNSDSDSDSDSQETTATIEEDTVS